MIQSARDARIPGPAPTAPLITIPLRARGILVVDDTEDIRALLDICLRGVGFAVRLASGGSAGVASYLENETDIDAILLDVRMPACDGPQALAGICAVNANVPCCFMSGDMGHYTEAYLIGLGAAAVLRKPFRLNELISQLWRLTSAS